MVYIDNKSVVGVNHLQVGDYKVPVLLIDQAVDDNITISGNSGATTESYLFEFFTTSYTRNGTLVSYVGENPITLGQGASYYTDSTGGTYLRIGAYTARQAVMIQRGIVGVGTPLLLVKGTNGKYFGGPATFGWVPRAETAQVVTNRPPEENLPGYTVATVPLMENYSFGYLVTNINYNALNDFISGISTDPYQNGGDTTPGGGSGTFTDTTDIIGFPGLPTLSATDTGFLTMYNPSVSQVKSLANYMWSNSLFDVDTWKKLFQSPMDGILGLNILPVQPVQGATQNVSIGNLATDVAMPLVTSQYVQVSCGSISVPDYFGSFLDTDPYTKMQVFLPYIGTVPVNANDVVGKSIEIQYNVDVLSGALVAFIKCDGTLKYQYSGACASQVPVTASNMSNLLSSTVSLVTSTAGLLAGGLGTVAGAVAGISSLASSAVNAGKQDVQRSGTMAGSPGQLGQQVPILIIARPKQAIPKNQNMYLGYPSFITAKIGNLSGYTEIDVTHVDNISATENELSEIKSLLQAGVIL